jgi:hypothetical protein
MICSHRLRGFISHRFGFVSHGYFVLTDFLFLTDSHGLFSQIRTDCACFARIFSDLVLFLTDLHGLFSQMRSDCACFARILSDFLFLTDSHGLFSQIGTDWRASHGFSQIWFCFSQIYTDCFHRCAQICTDCSVQICEKPTSVRNLHL